jgi:hypothetical protein
MLAGDIGGFVSFLLCCVWAEIGAGRAGGLLFLRFFYS